MTAPTAHPIGTILRARPWIRGEQGEWAHALVVPQVGSNDRQTLWFYEAGTVVNGEDLQPLYRDSRYEGTCLTVQDMSSTTLRQWARTLREEGYWPQLREYAGTLEQVAREVAAAVAA